MIFIIPILFFLTSFTIQGKDFQIKKITVLGLKNYSQTTIIHRLDNTDIRNINNVISELTLLNIFEKINIYIKKNNLIINLKEKPRISTIKIHSKNKNIIDQLLTDYEILPSMLFDHGNLELFRYNLDTYCDLRGLHNFNLQIKLIKNKTENTVRIKINFSKNAPIKIKHFFIYGNKNYSLAHLTSILTLRKTSWTSWIYKSNVYSHFRLNKELKKLKDFYLDHGYPDFYIKSSKVFLNKNKKFAYLLIDIHEGIKYTISHVLLENKKTYKFEEEVNELIAEHIKPGDVFSNKKATLLQQRLNNYFQYKGFLDIEITYILDRIGTGSANITYQYTKTPRTIINKIYFYDNDKISDMTLRKIITQMEKSIALTYKFEMARNSLTKNGYAKKFKFKLDKKKKPLKKNILVHIEEKSGAKFIAGCSYSRANGIGLHVDADLLNFLGFGYDLLCKFNKNRKLSDFNITYNVPSFSENYYDTSYNIYYKSEKMDKKSHTFTAITSFGFTVTQNITIDKYSKIQIISGGDKTFVKFPVNKAYPFIKQFVNKSGHRYKEYHIGGSFIHNTLDKTPNPRTGTNSKINVKITVPPSNLKYYIISGDVNIYKELFEDVVFSFYGNLCYGNKYGDETTAFPFFKHFYLLGKNNVRGYKEKTLGPRDLHNQPIGGNILILFKFCLHFPFPQPENKQFFKPYLFFDIGHTYHTETSFSNKPYLMPKGYEYTSFLKCSVGLSIHWGTPLGVPIEIAVAYPINPTLMDKIDYISIVIHSRPPTH
ncbi:MAG TPA: outer membrane protein assembly factor BamA [Candidatus Azoamicus sp. OHIO2]